MRLTQRQERLANQGHSPDIRKRRTGSTPTAPARPVYGTSVFCECGYRFKTNESPTKGGNKLCLDMWEQHATYCVAQTEANAIERAEHLATASHAPEPVEITPENRAIALWAGTDAMDLARALVTAHDLMDDQQAKLTAIDTITMLHSSTLARDVQRLLHPEDPT